ncbi:hypothetical protein M408DRAFT_23552 [Serendipita vermifera MAFF 305830]|uniref:Uncharacterized protein n=1 Tax=Serendipita vermifera MAFF 305830 TaxID=933852 RepID=A0A0C3AVC3_SERVB|nr:hypothetical protein M408DRAFT_23552 [Serendipita vermifera MAFF 305830]
MQLTVVTATLVIAHATQGLAAPILELYKIEDLVARSDGPLSSAQDRWKIDFQGVAKMVPNVVVSTPVAGNRFSAFQAVVKAAKTPPLPPPQHPALDSISPNSRVPEHPRRPLLVSPRSLQEERSKTLGHSECTKR